MSLDLDTQAIMMSHLTAKKDVLAFMRTNRAHYDAGFQRLLQFRVVVHDRRLEDFCDFMLSGSIPRLPGLHQISFVYGWGLFRNPAKAHIVGRLVSVLQGARHIKKLDITHCEDFLKLDPQIGSAITSLEHLESLLLHNATQGLSLGLLKNLTSSVTTLDLAIYLERPLTFPEDDIRAAPTSAIATLALSLENLTLHRTSLAGNTIQFPKVKSLIMNESHGPDKACLAHTFPNLQRLSFETANHNYSMDRDEAREQRQVNRSVDQGDKATTLKFLSARLIDIYSWGFSGEFEEMIITEVLQYQHGMLPVVLNDALPRKLELNLSASQTSSYQFVQLLPDSIAPRLEELRMNIEMRMYDSDEGYSDLLVGSGASTL